MPDYLAFRRAYRNDLLHVGKGHDDNPPGRGSGRYPYGSGERPFQSEETSFYKESNKTIRTNRDGSKSFPKDFIFNRVGGNSMDVNDAGALYVSYGKDDAMRYIKYLGPTPMAKLLGTASTTIQHISVNEPLRMPSEKQLNKMSLELLLEDRFFYKSVTDSVFSLIVEDSDLSVESIKRALNNPSSSTAKKITYVISSSLADPNYVEEAKKYYTYLRKNGWDAIPDLHDTMSGIGETSTIIINPNKVKIISTTIITKEVMKTGKKYIKTIGNLKISELLK